MAEDPTTDDPDVLGVTISGNCEINRRRYPRDAGETAIFRTTLDVVVVVFLDANPFEGGPLILRSADGDTELTVKSALDLGLGSDEEREYPYCLYDGGQRCEGCDSAIAAAEDEDEAMTPPRMIIRG